MSYLLSLLGRGLVSRLETVFENHFPQVPADTIDELEERLTQSPKSADLAVRLGHEYLRAGRLAEAQRVFERPVVSAESPRLSAIGRACIFDELGDQPQVVSLLKQARRMDPRDPATIFALALTHERMGALGAARTAYRNALATCPRLKNAYERLAAIAMRDCEWDEALACYEQLAELDGEDLDTLLLLGTLYLKNNMPLEAFDRFQIALLVEPESADAPALPDLDGVAGAARVQQSVRTLQKLVADYPALASYRVRLADLLARRGDDQEALREYHAALALQPNYLEATVKLGTHHLRCGRLVAAAQTFNQATELNDRLTFAFVAMGEAQRRNGHPEDADSTLDLAASIEPSSTLLLSETTRLHLKAATGGVLRDELGGCATGVDTAAIAAREITVEDVVQRHRRALAAQRGRADLHYRYGVLLRQCGRTPDAIEAFQHAVQINPYYSKGLLKLGLSCREVGDHVAANQALHAVVNASDDAIRSHYQLALVFTQPNKFHAAVEEFSSDAEAPAGRDGLRGALENVGLIDGVAATWRSLTDLANDPDDLIQRRRQTICGV